MEGFFFIILKSWSLTQTTNHGKASLADILFQKLFSMKKSAKNVRFCRKRQNPAKSSKSCEKLKILRNPAKPRKSCSPARNPGPQPESAPQPEMPPRTSNPGSQDLKSWTPDARPLQNLGSWHPKTTLCDQFLKKCPAMVKTEAFFFGG